MMIIMRFDEESAGGSDWRLLRRFSLRHPVVHYCEGHMVLQFVAWFVVVRFQFQLLNVFGGFWQPEGAEV